MSSRVARPLTLIAGIPEFLCTRYSRHDLLGKFLTVLKPDDVSCIQFVPKRYARITFKTFAVRQAVLQSGITIESSRLTVFEADPVTIEVSVEHLPFEVVDQDLCDALSPFGEVHSVRLQNYADSNVLTGTRVLSMSLTSDIPVNVRVLRYPCRVLYRGQPRPCSICRSDGHRASGCLLRGKCRRCLQPGHFARDCVAEASEPDPSFDPEDESVDDDDVDESDVSEDIASGDEEVVEAVEAVASPASSDVPAPPSVSPSEDKEPAVVAPAPPAAPAPSSVSKNVSKDSVASRVKRRFQEVSSSNFRWIARFPQEFRHNVLSSGRSPDCHVIKETYRSSDDQIFYVHCILDFGVNTFRVLTDQRTFEDCRLRSYEQECMYFDNVFPGVQASSGKPLSPNTEPLKFPV